MLREHYSFLVKELNWWIQSIPYFLKDSIPHQYGVIKRAYNTSLVRALINGYINEYIDKYEDIDSKNLLKTLHNFNLIEGQDIIRAITLLRKAKIVNGRNDMELALERMEYLRDEIKKISGENIESVDSCYIPNGIKKILSTRLAIDAIYSNLMPSSIKITREFMDCLEPIENKDLKFPIMTRFGNKLFKSELETILAFNSKTTTERYYLMEHPIKGNDANKIDILIYTINNNPIYIYKVNNIDIFKKAFTMAWSHLTEEDGRL